MARSGDRNALTPSAATRRASMSRPESISSRMHRLGWNSAICSTFFRFFSPPGKATFDAAPEHVLRDVQRSRDLAHLLQKVRRRKFAFAARLALRIERGAQEIHGGD